MARKLIAAAVVILLAAAIWLYLPAYRAHRVLSQVSELQVGKSTFADAQALAAKLDAQARGTCSETDCNWYRTVDNSGLPAFWIGPGSHLSIGFRVQKGVVTERGIAYQIGSGSTIVAYADVEERSNWSNGPAPSPVSVQTQWTPHVPHYSALVLMVPAVPAATRSKYLDFNLNCLWRYGGCADANQLLPTVEWHD